MNNNIGWVCPVCGKGNAPWKTSCDCINDNPDCVPYKRYPYNPNPYSPFNPIYTGSPIPNPNVIIS